MASSTKYGHWIRGFVGVVFRDLHREQDGKITLVATIMMLAMVVLMGLIGNAGHAVNQKMEAQNAADAVAFSSALWMARGMNALTATNHMLGEATALCAIHEALGGPGLDLRLKQNTSENRTLDATINATRNTAPLGFPVPSPYGFTPPSVTNLDKRIVDFVTKRTTPAGGGELEAFASIYDSKMTLKRELAVLLPIKSFADVGFFVPPPWGYATAAIAYGVHIYSTTQIVVIGKEWVILDVLETVAKAFTKLKLNVLEAQLIPTLVAHGNFVARLDPESGEAEEGILNSAVQRMLLDLQGRHEAEFAIYPAADKLRLPVEPEPRPSLRSGQNVVGWGSDDAAPVSTKDSGLGDLERRLDKNKREMTKRIADLTDNLTEFDKFENEIDERLDEDDIPDDERAELDDEKTAIAASRADLQKKLNQLRKDLAELRAKERQLKQLLNQPSPPSTNPSVARIPRQMNQSQERFTQWVRATYPYTDAFRAPVRAMFENLLPKSNAAGHFTKWSNRYTMVKAWQFRSGYRLEKSGSTATWKKQNAVKPLSMLVLNDSFEGERSRKGREPWTTSTESGKKKAEAYFTLIGFAHRDFKPLFSKVVYPAPSGKGMTAYAQAIFYNGNEQRVAASSRVQAKLGWDTLNWDPGNEVGEWAAPPSDSNAKWPWDVFSSSDQPIKVKLNWQAKLMPVTATRLRESDESLSGSMAENVSHAIEYFEELGAH